ncbi:MAG: MiaB/RimO family radical SAM methylthiotransferase [Acidimicrobiales bacterium]
MAEARKFVVRTFGCQMNEHDSERIASVLAADGMARTEDVEDADVVVLNTCCIRQNADDKLYGHLGQLKSVQARRPGMQIAVGGCLAQKDRDLLIERAPQVNVVFGTHNVARVAALLELARSTGEPVVDVPDAPGDDEATDFPAAMAVKADRPHAAWVTIQVGCDNSCAYCIVPSVRGPEVSRPFGELVGEVESLASRGAVEITLLGQNVNSYGRDLTIKARSSGDDSDLALLVGGRWVNEAAARPRPLFADLLREVGAVPGIRRVRFTSPHPKDLSPDTIAAMAETEAVCEQLHLPLQSGSDRVLKQMRRGYTRERYLFLVQQARDSIADLALTTDVIVGFPGETEEDFAQTLEVASQVEYDSAYTFVFSPRPGTRAAALRELFVPPEDIAERFARLKVVTERSALARNSRRVGRVEEAIVEGSSRKDPQVLSGRTRQGKLVHFSPRVGEVLVPGSFVRVRIESAGPHHLGGVLLAPGDDESARTRPSIPVVTG